MNAVGPPCGIAAAISVFPALPTQTNNTDVSAMIGVDGHVQLGEQLADALIDLVSDRAHGVEAWPAGSGSSQFS